MKEKLLNLIADTDFAFLAWIVVIPVVLSACGIIGIWSPEMLGIFFGLLVLLGIVGIVSGGIWGGVILSDYHENWSYNRKNKQRFLKQRRMECAKGKEL